MPVKYDCCIYANESELFEARVLELADAVDYFVVVESPHSHQGQPKALTFDLGRWAGELGDRLIYWTVDLPEPGGHRGGAGTPMYQVRERAQRDATWDAIQRSGSFTNWPEPQPDDVFLLSDVDEIPTAQGVALAVDLLAAGETEVEFMMAMDAFALGWRYPGPWRGTTAVACRRLITGAVTPSGMRDERASGRTVNIGGYMLGSAGWHLTWMGGPTRAAIKQEWFSHAELNGRSADEFAGHISDGIDSNGVQLLPAMIDSTYPRWVREGRAPGDWYRPGAFDPVAVADD